MSLQRYVKQVSTVLERASIVEVARLMRSHHVGAVIVVSEERKPVGLISDRDIALRVVAKELDPKATRAAEVMTPNVTALGPNGNVQEATVRMRECGVRRLPMVDADGKVVGLVALDDMVLLLGVELGNLAQTILRGMTREVA